MTGEGTRHSGGVVKIKKFFLSLSFFLLRGKFKKREENGIEKTFLKENEINDSKIF